MIELKNVSKCYGNEAVLKDISLSIEKNGIYCLLGRNGAGKTTLLKSIAGHRKITEGQIRINGKRISPSSLESDVCYIENWAKHFNLPVGKLLRTAAGINGDYDFEFSLEMMERFELDGKKKFNQLSLGMKTMVSTIISLSSSKSVILLDEPVLGFDAVMRMEFYELLKESYSRHPRIIIVSTHIIEEIESSIDCLIIIDKGRLIFSDTLEAVSSSAFTVSGLQEDVEKAVEGKKVLARDIKGGLECAYIFGTPPTSPSIRAEKMTLLDFFICLTAKGGKRK